MMTIAQALQRKQHVFKSPRAMHIYIYVYICAKTQGSVDDQKVSVTQTFLESPDPKPEALEFKHAMLGASPDSLRNLLWSCKPRPNKRGKCKLAVTEILKFTTMKTSPGVAHCRLGGICFKNKGRFLLSKKSESPLVSVHQADHCETTRLKKARENKRVGSYSVDNNCNVIIHERAKKGTSQEKGGKKPKGSFTAASNHGRTETHPNHTCRNRHWFPFVQANR